MRGDGDDFYGVREYAPGDELRRVHWRTSARTGTLAVAEYAQGVTLDITLALDLSLDAYKNTGTDEHSALETAVTLTATLLGDLLKHGHSVRLLIAGGRDTPLAGGARRGAQEMLRFLETLARVQADSLQTLADVVAEDRDSNFSPATTIAITPDWPNARLAETLHSGEARGSRFFVFALDAASFRTGGPGLTTALADPSVTLVRRGDDLTALLERNDDGWPG